MKRYVDVKRCYKKILISFYKKKKKKVIKKVIFCHFYLVCKWDDTLVLIDWRQTAKSVNHQFSNHCQASPVLSKFLISKSMAQVSGV